MKIIKNFLKNHNIVETISYYDKPLIFIVKSNRKLYYIHWEDIQNNVDFYLVKPVNKKQIKNLKNNKITIRKLFQKRGELFIWKIGKEETLYQSSLKNHINEIPNVFLNLSN
ncbi:MAG: hypothetical protein EKK64_08535 [Neisseriaceae bacterium]|nr:MAG: hypothetical protein EKK64_08535 [Neisseriaceae bacterium]